MADPVWLPEVLRAEGLEVREFPGWRDRGHGDFGDIWGVVAHHTGSFGATPGSIANHPTLGLCSQLYLGSDGAYTVVGAGIAYHAGQGAYPGLPRDNANAYTIGIEAANDGGGSPGRPHRSSWSDAQYDAYVRGVAAILRHLGHDASRIIAHREWAGAAQGKWDPGAIDMPTFRRDVQAAIGGTPAHQEDDMPTSADVAKALLATRLKRPDGTDGDTVGNVLAWIDQHAAQLVVEQLGPGSEAIRGPVVTPTRWAELGDRTQVEALAALLDAAGIEGRAK
ncbi:peptidoglycan recognition protein family protein [Nocardia arizonensis]|uniref:peptidoglycan recognition protein family protein n=1 Tax=Nocardia arizonensis TaxID=1141647 RepID=UPI0006D16BC8|nr:N-acetylmuramoyl-L-alanine amidase [Nocardia arizonensis]